ncbi:hypothetical protein ES707_16683 [subsurface metagenome]
MKKVLTLTATLIIFSAGSLLAGWQGIMNSGSPIDTGADENAKVPDVAFDGQGNAIAIFQQFDGADFRLYARYWNGSSWSIMNNGNPIDNGNAQHVSRPYLSFDSQGNAIVVFPQDTATKKRLFARKWDGTEWKLWTPSGWQTFVDTTTTPGESIDPGIDRAVFHPIISFDYPKNAAYIIYKKSDGLRDRLWAVRLEGSNWEAWTTDGWQVFVDTTTTPLEYVDAGININAFHSSIAFDSNNNAILVFDQYYQSYARRWDGTDWRIWTSNGWQVFVDTATTPAQPIDLGMEPAVWYPRPTISFDSQDNAIVAFLQSDGSNDRIYAGRWDGTNWKIWTSNGWQVFVDTTTTPGEPIDTGISQDVNRPSIGFDAGDNAIVVFEQSDGTDYHIYAAKYDGTDWSVMNGGYPIDTGINQDAKRPEIGFDHQGNAILVFDQQGVAAAERIYANRYAFLPLPSGATLTPEAYRVVYGTSGTSVEIEVSTSPIKGAKISIPADAFVGIVWLTISSVNNLPRVAGITPIGEAVDFAPSGLLFASGKETTITLPYTDAELVQNNITADQLGLFYYNPTTGKWEAVAGVTVNKTNRVVSGNVSHLSLYILGASLPGLDNVKVYPNPYKPGSGGLFDASGISFVGLAGETKIKIYNIAGELVLEQDNNEYPDYEWNIRNKKGKKVASGVYIYLITNDRGNKKIGKFTIVK